MTSVHASTNSPACGWAGSKPLGETTTSPTVPAGGGPSGPKGSSHQRAPGRCGSWATATSPTTSRPVASACISSPHSGSSIGPHEAGPVEPRHHGRVVAADEGGTVGERCRDLSRRRQREHGEHRLAGAEGEGGQLELAGHRLVVRSERLGGQLVELAHTQGEHGADLFGLGRRALAPRRPHPQSPSAAPRHRSARTRPTGRRATPTPNLPPQPGRRPPGGPHRLHASTRPRSSSRSTVPATTLPAISARARSVAASGRLPLTSRPAHAVTVCSTLRSSHSTRSSRLRIGDPLAEHGTDPRTQARSLHPAPVDQR